MPKLSQVILFLEDGLLELKKACSTKTENLDLLHQEIYQRYFIRSFCILAERLIFFRNADSCNMSREEMLNFKEQFGATNLIGDCKDNSKNNLVIGFTKRRNKLLHKHLLSFYQGDNSIYEDAKQYADMNLNLLAEKIQELRSDPTYAESTEISKLSFSYKSNTSYSFAEDHQLPLEAVLKEISFFLYIINDKDIKLQMLANDSNRLADELVSKQIFEVEIKEMAEKLSKCMNNDIMFHFALINCFENICTLLALMNRSYDGLYEEVSLQDDWEKIDQLYEVFFSHEKQAQSFLLEVGKKRVGFAHELESMDADLSQFVLDLLSVYVLQSYLTDYLNIVLKKRAKKLVSANSFSSSIGKQDVAYELSSIKAEASSKSAESHSKIESQKINEEKEKSNENERQCFEVSVKEKTHSKQMSPTSSPDAKRSRSMQNLTFERAPHIPNISASLETKQQVIQTKSEADKVKRVKEEPSSLNLKKRLK